MRCVSGLGLAGRLQAPLGMTFKKILCPTDFSEGARHALAYAAQLAIHDQAELVIVHAWELPVFSGGFPIAPEVIQQSLDESKKLLDEALREARALGVPTVSGRELRGLPWRAIVEHIADDHGIDLVVMGTHGRTGLRRVLLGSVAERVVRMSPASVLAIHPDDHVGPFHHVLCPTDFSDPTEYPLVLASQIVETHDATDARIDFVHVVPDVVDFASVVTADAEALAGAELARRVQQVKATCPIISRTEAGRVSEQLVTLVEIEPYDLVVVASHGRTGLKHVVLGSIAEKLVRHARCPVLVARQRGVAL